MAKAVVANDHGAVELAARVVEHLKNRGYEGSYLGTDKEESIDYPDKAEEAVMEYRKGGYDFGVRCALPETKYAATMAKEHNNANFIAFGGRIDYKEDVLDILDGYLDASFEGGRHQRRIDKMMALEGK